jgi:hypothetical protein
MPSLLLLMDCSLHRLHDLLLLPAHQPLPQDLQARSHL